MTDPSETAEFKAWQRLRDAAAASDPDHVGDPFEHERFVPNAQMDAMQRMRESEPARFYQLFTSTNRQQLAFYVAAKERAEAKGGAA